MHSTTENNFTENNIKQLIKHSNRPVIIL
jgi:hypothetical protein